MPPSGEHVAVVTGANQGLGYALVETFCRVLGPDWVVYLTTRDPDRGQAATAALRAAGHDPTFHPLDVTLPGSVLALAEMLQSRHGGIDLVISNAAARIDPATPQAAQVRGFVDTNNHGTTRLMRALGPLLRDGRGISSWRARSGPCAICRRRSTIASTSGPHLSPTWTP
ncbi:MAG: SDR family NAD(P)-dependent oxidoreductase [Gemmatimonadales bacterium]|nr:SDR family NAD(P)-dependent oxidoreductase [Gemmatimonadales bacterium]